MTLLYTYSSANARLCINIGWTGDAVNNTH